MRMDWRRMRISCRWRVSARVKRRRRAVRSKIWKVSVTVILFPKTLYVSFCILEPVKLMRLSLLSLKVALALAWV